jgi:hypothetical protein
MKKLLFIFTAFLGLSFGVKVVSTPIDNFPEMKKFEPIYESADYAEYFVNSGIFTQRSKIIFFNTRNVFNEYQIMRRQLVNCETGDILLINETTFGRVTSDRSYLDDRSYKDNPKNVTPSDISALGKLRDRECKRLGF